jgi:hypothetical protein
MRALLAAALLAPVLILVRLAALVDLARVPRINPVRVVE